MLKSVLLVQAEPERASLYINNLPPLGILYISAYLEKKGYPCYIIDSNRELEKTDISAYSLIGFSVNLANIEFSLKKAEEIKRAFPGVKIIFGGPSCISNPEYFNKKSFIDAVCECEGEYVLAEYAEYLNASLSETPRGLHVLAADGSRTYSGSRPYIEDLDSLPYPSFEKTDIKKYLVPLGQRRPVSCICTSRGCPYSCSFCFHSMGKKWRGRSAENIVKEIEWQVRELKIKEICIQDDNFFFDIKRAERIFDMIIDLSLDIRLQIFSGMRVESITFDMLKKMRSAGVWIIALCPETGSPKVMEEINKKVDLDKYRTVIEWCRHLDIFTYVCFIFGFPFETREDLSLTLKFIESIDCDVIHITRALPIPKTPLYDRYSECFQEKDFGISEGMLYGSQKLPSDNISPDEFDRFIKTAYRKVYFNPLRAIRILKKLPVSNIIRLFYYAIVTRSI